MTTEQVQSQVDAMADSLFSMLDEHGADVVKAALESARRRYLTRSVREEDERPESRDAVNLKCVESMLTASVEALWLNS